MHEAWSQPIEHHDNYFSIDIQGSCMPCWYVILYFDKLTTIINRCFKHVHDQQCMHQDRFLYIWGMWQHHAWILTFHDC